MRVLSNKKLPQFPKIRRRKEKKKKSNGSETSFFLRSDQIMAELSILVTHLIEKLLSALSKESPDAFVRKLEEPLSIILPKVDRGVDAEASKWLKEVRDVVYDAEALLDEGLIEAPRLMGKKFLHRVQALVRDCFLPHMIIRLRQLEFAGDGLPRSDRQLRWKRAMGDVCIRLGEETSRRLEEDLQSGGVYGRGTDKEKVVNFLLDEEEDSDNHISLLAIVGPGGVGKTTLAQLAFNDVEVQHSFDLKFWVCVSVDVFNVRRVLIEILQSAKGKQIDHSMERDTIHQHLLKTIGGKRFLLVLDDVWDENLEEWGILKASLKYGKEGSKVVVTTQTHSIARVMGGAALHLEVLSEDHCWSLFKERAFGARREEEETPFLVEIGKEISRNCGGLPLAVKALGSLLGIKRQKDEWLNVLEVLKEDEDATLRLICCLLPPHLWLCFSYCSLFPRGYVVVKKKLVRLWMGAGLIPWSDEGMNLEDIADHYFNFLLQMSFFQDEARDAYGNVVSCKINSVFRDLAHRAAESYFLSTGCVVSDAYRHISLISNEGPLSKILKNTPYPETLRSLIVFGETQHLTEEVKMFVKRATRLRVLSGFPIIKFPRAIGKLIHLRLLDLSNTMIDVLPESVSRLRQLQLLDLSDTEIVLLPEWIASLYDLQVLDLQNCHKLLELPPTIGELKNLRILNLSNSSVQVLPESTSGLQSLQTLDLSNCSELRELPDGIQNMSKLNHLDISQCELICMPPGLGRLHSLQTLPLFVVGKEPGCTIEELQHLHQIKGELKIIGLCNVEDPVEAMAANLGAKVYLHSLELWGRAEWRRNCEQAVIDWAAVSPPSKKNIDEQIFENLKPSPNLRRLTIEDYGGSIFPTWLTGVDQSSSFPKLESFSLYNVERCESLPPLGALTSLKHLQIESMYALKRIDAVGGTFSSLKYLKLWNLPALEEWFVPEGNVFPSLERLIIIGCPKLRVQPRLPSSLVELQMESVHENLLSKECLQGLSTLRKLKIAHFEASESGWEGLQQLTSLQELKIMNCYLTRLPDCIMQHHFTSLWTLKLSLNNDLEALGEGKGGEPPLLFSELRHLTVKGCDELTSLPEWLGGLTFLQSLELSYCDNLAMLPQKLPTGLTQVIIHDCPSLEGDAVRTQVWTDSKLLTYGKSTASEKGT